VKSTPSWKVEQYPHPGTTRGPNPEVIGTGTGNGHWIVPFGSLVYAVLRAADAYFVAICCTRDTTV